MVCQLPSGQKGGLPGPAQFAGDVDGDNFAPIGGQLPVGIDEITDGRLGGSGQGLLGLDTVVELHRADIDSFAEALQAKLDIERNNSDIISAEPGRRQVTGGVGYNFDH